MGDEKADEGQVLLNAWFHHHPLAVVPTSADHPAPQWAMPRRPDLEYQARLEAARAALDVLTAADARFAYARLATFLSGVTIAAIAAQGFVTAAWLLVPALVFLFLVWRHARLVRARELAARRIAFYERGLARLDDRWAGTGEPGERFRSDSHVYANDLDLFGTGSLFELLSLARTRTGEAMLAGWLTTAADPPEIEERQDAVKALAAALDLREQLAISGVDVRASVRTDRLLDWAESPMPPRRRITAVVWIFTGSIAAAILYLAATAGWWPLAAVMILHALAMRRFRVDLNAMLSTAEPGSAAGFVADALGHRALELGVLAELLEHLERATFKSGRLALLQGRLLIRGQPASRIIRRLNRLSEWNDSQENTAAIPLLLFLVGAYTGQTWLLGVAIGVGGLLMLVRPHLALAVERWRRGHGREVRVWIEAIAQFEALSSLAGYHFEHPEDPFPQVVSLDQGMNKGAVFAGIQLGHPLLPRAAMVRNDVTLSDRTSLLVISGSNMSGKSTLLRTVGINAVLALAGAPVRAGSLRLSPLAIGATLRIQDSLLEGRSRFYAEISRIRTLADIAAGPVPLLFLLDEIFHGTNSHDRLIGAGGVLRSLLARGAVGLITTHDLALTAIADEPDLRALNVHFDDSFEHDAIIFDYRMKPGPVTRSNALALMRAVGLEVSAEQS